MKQDKRLTGISEKCIFHTIPNFHVTKNLSVNVMHDIFEGVCQYDLGLVLHHFIIKEKLFTLDDVNTYVKAFDYGRYRNAPPQILESHVKNRRLMMSASEMLCFIRHFTLLFGCHVPESDRYWDLVLQLRRIAELVTSSSIHIDTTLIIHERISEYLQSLNSLFPNSIKPKHHFMLHYSRVFTISGPLWNLSSIRFESMNRQGKISSHVAICRVNVCRTLAIKHQLQQNFRFLNNQLPSPYNYRNVQEFSLTSLPNIKDYKHLLPSLLQNVTTVSTVEKLNFESVEISDKCIIMLSSDDGPMFYTVEKILLSDSKELALIVKLLLDVYFDQHMDAYEIFTDCCEWRCIVEEELRGSIITNKVRVMNGKNYIVRNWF